MYQNMHYCGILGAQVKWAHVYYSMKANPHVCSERQRREERDVVNDVEDDK